MHATPTLNDSLAFSQILQDEENLLASDILEQQNHEFGGQGDRLFHNETKHDRTVDTRNKQWESSLSCYLGREDDRDVGKTVKSCKRLAKEKSQLMNCDPRVQRISLKAASKVEKIGELISLVQGQRMLQCERRLRNFIVELIEVADDVISQKKSLQRELDNMIEMNKLMSSKLREIQKYLQFHESRKVCTCAEQYELTKVRESPMSYLDKFEFARTIITSVEEFEIKKIQDEENLDQSCRPLLEVLWELKNKAQGSVDSLDRGLISNAIKGHTLRSWVQKIEQRMTTPIKISEFQLDEEAAEQTLIPQFLALVQNSQEHLILNIKKSDNPCRQAHLLKQSSLLTFVQILQQSSRKLSRQEILSDFGMLNRSLNLIMKKSGVTLDQEQEIVFTPNIMELLTCL